MVNTVTITEDDGTVYACQSREEKRIIDWLGWYIESQSGGAVRVQVTQNAEVDHEFVQ